MNSARRWLSLLAWSVSNTLASLAIKLDPEQDQFDQEVERVRSVMLRAVESHRRECIKPDPNVN